MIHFKIKVITSVLILKMRLQSIHTFDDGSYIDLVLVQIDGEFSHNVLFSDSDRHDMML